MGIREGWYCAGRAEDGRRTLLGRTLTIARRGGRLEARDGARLLATREVLGLAMVWHGARTPHFELPWSRLDDPRWRFRPARARVVSVDHRRPFADYFDHWQTTHVHRVACRVVDVWFHGSRAGVVWNAPPSVGRDGGPSRRALRTTSSATLYGLGFALDERSRGGVDFVVVRCCTPLGDERIELHTAVGVRTSRWIAPLADVTGAILERTNATEMERDVAYWRVCAAKRVARDERSEDDLERYYTWCSALPAS